MRPDALTLIRMRANTCYIRREEAKIKPNSRHLYYFTHMAVLNLCMQVFAKAAIQGTAQECVVAAGYGQGSWRTTYVHVT